MENCVRALLKPLGERLLLQNYGFVLLLALAAVAMGIKALTPAGIQLTENAKLNRKTSVILGIATIAFGVAVAIVGFVVIVLPHVAR